MQIILVAVTIGSLTLTALMAATLIRLLREERRRSDARVALLTQLANENASADRTTLKPRSAVVSEPVAGAARLSPPALSDLPLHGRETEERPVASQLFIPTEHPSVWPRRLVVVGVLISILIVGIVGLSFVSSAPSGSQDRQATHSERPLELLSLSHSHENGTLTITGLVRNPHSNAQLTHVHATVLVFDGNATLVTSGRAPLDFNMLSAGDDSPFVIRVPVRGLVARYRVGFRTADDRVLGHVDLRQSDSVARKEEP